jgi:predicted RNase H-like nuclease
MSSRYIGINYSGVQTPREPDGVAAALTTPEPGAGGLEIKVYEDALDAVVCAWVAVCAPRGTRRCVWMK